MSFISLHIYLSYIGLIECQSKMLCVSPVIKELCYLSLVPYQSLSPSFNLLILFTCHNSIIFLTTHSIRCVFTFPTGCNWRLTTPSEGIYHVLHSCLTCKCLCITLYNDVCHKSKGYVHVCDQ